MKTVRELAAKAQEMYHDMGSRHCFTTDQQWRLVVKMLMEELDCVSTPGQRVYEKAREKGWIDETYETTSWGEMGESLRADWEEIAYEANEEE